MNVSANNNTFPSAAPRAAMTNQPAAPCAAMTNQTKLKLTEQHSKHKQHTNFNIFSRLALSLLLALAATNVMAQYDATYNDEEVQTKAPVWYSYPEYTDPLGGNGKTEINSDASDDNERYVQTAHEYVNYIYCHQGDDVELHMPFTSTDDNGDYIDWDYKDYYRWFDYRTGSNFYTSVTNGYTVFFDNSSTHYSQVYAWVYDEGGGNYTGGTWPGQLCENIYGDIWQWSSVNGPTSNGKIMFSDNGNNDSKVGEFGYTNYATYDGDGLQSTGSSTTITTDLLVPKGSGGTLYRFSNGYVTGYSMANDGHFGGAVFHYPKDGQCSDYKNNGYYVVACDYSNYNDFYKAEDLQTYTVYFRNTDSWSNVYVYIWNTTTNSAYTTDKSWGNLMQKVSGTDDVYEYSVKGINLDGSAGLIFTKENWADETNDYVFYGGHIYGPSESENSVGTAYSNSKQNVRRKASVTSLKDLNLADQVSSITTTVFFKNFTGTWGDITPKAYVWNGGTVYTTNSWPGDYCTEVNSTEHIYKWTYDGTLPEDTQILFADDDGNLETDDMTLYNGGFYYAGEHKQSTYVYTVTEDIDLPVAEDEYVVYFDTRGTSWSTVRIYATDNSLGNWPSNNTNIGTECDKVSEGLYKYVGNLEGKTIIFNNDATTVGQGQTENLTWVNGGYYFITGLYDVCSSEHTYTASFANSVEWSNVYAYVYYDDGEGNITYYKSDGSTTNSTEDSDYWPGDKLTLEDGKYTWSFTTTDTLPDGVKIVFNDGTVASDAVEKVNKTIVYDFEDGGEYDLVASTFTVYFDNTVGWENVYACVYYTDDKGTTTYYSGNNKYGTTDTWKSDDDKCTQVTVDGETLWVWSYTNTLDIPEGATVVFYDGTKDSLDDAEEKINRTGENTSGGNTFVSGQTYSITVYTYTVYFENAIDWTNVYAYVYSDDTYYDDDDGIFVPGTTTDNWPGTLCTYDQETGKWTWTYSSVFEIDKGTQIVFNDGTEDSLTGETSEPTDTRTSVKDFENKGQYRLDSEGNEEQIHTYTVYFANTIGWEAVYACVYYYDNGTYTYYHNDNAGDDGFPGDLCEYTGGRWVWTYTSTVEIPEGAVIIFNDGTKESLDESEEKVNRTDERDFVSEQTYDLEKLHTIYFDTSNITGWTEVYAHVTDIDDTSMSLVDGSNTLYMWQYAGEIADDATVYFTNQSGATTITWNYIEGNVYAEGAPLVACESFFGNNFCEPTLIGRVLFYIIDVDNLDTASDIPADAENYSLLLTDSDYSYSEGSEPAESDKKYLEEYNMTFPSRHCAHSDELVGLAMDANAYALPNDGGSDELTVKVLGGNERVIDLVSVDKTDNYKVTQGENISISGLNRAISFTIKGGTAQTGESETYTWDLGGDYTATIIVTKEVSNTIYNIARYNLTFSQENVALTDKQVKDLDEFWNPEDGSTPTKQDIEDSGKWWFGYSYRSPEYAQKNLTELTELNFDDFGEYDSYSIFGSNIDAGGKAEKIVTQAFSAFPMEWDYTGYGFNNGTMSVRDGSKGAIDSDNTKEHVNAGQYTIMSDYYGWDDDSGDVSSYVKNTSGAWMYVDGTQTPGTIADLPIHGTFCKGTKLYATAWVKGANRTDATTYDSTHRYYRDDTSIIMTIKGHSGGSADNLACASSGQIRRTDGISKYSDDGDNTGKGSENQWMQVYFSFTINSDATYDSYSLQLMNYSASSSGADFYFDDLCVYVSHPTYDVSQTIQTSGDHEGLYRADFDYDALMLYEDDGEEHSSADGASVKLDFVIFNENIYRDYLINQAGTYDMSTLKEDSNYYNIEGGNKLYNDTFYNLITGAINAAAIELHDNDGSSSYGYAKTINTAAFYYYWDTNAEYSDDVEDIKDNHTNMIALADYGNMTWNTEPYTFNAVWLYGRTDVNEEKKLSVDFYARINPYVPYRIVAITYADSETSETILKAIANALIDETCSMSEEFYFTSTTEVKLNGELLDPTQTYCEGQTNNISVHQTYLHLDRQQVTETDDDSNTTTKNVDVATRTEMLYYSYCDWFYGTEDEYLSDGSGHRTEVKGPTVSGTYSVSPEEALKSFRDLYPTEPDLAQAKKDDYGDGTCGWYNLIDDYVKAGKIVLYEQTLNVYANNGDTYLVIQPIIHENDDNPINESSNVPFPYEVSYAYIALELRTGTSEYDDQPSPELQPGFADVTYEGNYYHLVPNVRLGLSQIATAKSSALTVNLQQPTASSLELLDSGSTPYGPTLYLVGSTDPAYHTEDYLDKDDFSLLDLPMGTISNLQTNTSGNSRSGNSMQLRFNSNFNPNEGYCYVMSAYFGENGGTYGIVTDEESGDTLRVCPGLMQIEFKVVPEYLVWQGDMRDNWNRDGAWKRADRSDLLLDQDGATGTDADGNERTEYAIDGSYTANSKLALYDLPEGNTPCGYVPMLFSNVLIPNDQDGTHTKKKELNSRAEIYNAGFAEDSNMYSWSEPDEMGTSEQIIIDPQTNIMYDMPVYNNSTELYRVNLCKQIQFASDAQMLHSELLLYSKANTDVKIPEGVWTSVSTPLKDVVAGDWYTNKPDRGVVPYFTDIEFKYTNEADNDRYNPIVFQRSWAKSGDIIHMEAEVASDTDGGTPVYEQPVVSYDATGWTSVFNDASEAFNYGAGYSVKTYTQDDEANGAVGAEGTAYNAYDADNLVYQTFRLPKSDDDFDYYKWSNGASADAELSETDVDNGFSRGTNTGKLFISDFVTRAEGSNKDADGVYNDGSSSTTDDIDDASPITATVQAKKVNVAAEGEDPDYKYYALVGNPFTAMMSLSKFLTENTNITGYWIKAATDGTAIDLTKEDTYEYNEDADGPILGNADTNSWGKKDYNLEPYGAFFVCTSTADDVKDSDGTTVIGYTINVNFTPDMQVLEVDEEGGSPSKLTTFSIRAKSEAGTTSAAISYGDAASDEYDPDEDVILLRDASWYSDKLPMVYTVAGEKAVGVNRLKAQTVIPIGVELADSCSYTLTFAGVDNLDSPMLYDAADETETPITEGFTLNMSGASHGRYFIRTANIEEHGIEEDVAEYSITAYSPANRTIVVSSNAGIESVEIYSVGGVLEKRASGNGSIACTVDGVDSGVAIVRARTSEGTFTRKITVK